MHDFAVWAPKQEKVAVQVDGKAHPMTGPDKDGYFHASVEIKNDCRYGYLLGDDPTPYPDPRSLRQAEGVHGLSSLYDHGAFRWTDAMFRGNLLSGAILYEVHVGTFSEQGTFDGAIGKLDHLVDLGVTHLALMPVAEFAGNRGWGYDGVALFAVMEAYGGPEGLKRLVDAAHAKGLSVVLDVVYNHFGPVGNYANKFGPYLNEKHRTPWGAAVNFDEGGSDQVRNFFIDNAMMWLNEYHCDGLRLDAVHEFYDRSAVHFMEELSAHVSALGDMLNRKLVLIAESDLNDPKVVRPREALGYGMDAQWSDDFHHALFTILYTKEPGRGYYDDFGSIKDLAKALKGAFVYTGQYSSYRLHSHGRPVDGLSAKHFICFDQNHDQVGNRAKGERLEHLIGMDGAKVAIGLTLMAPFVPMLFMGEEWAASSPFLYFADHEEEEMRKLVSEGRKRDFAAFGFNEDEIPNPEDAATMENSKLKWTEVGDGKHADMFAWTKALIELRRNTLSLNDGDFGHLEVECDTESKYIVMTRGAIRVLVNFSDKNAQLPARPQEELKLSSKPEGKLEGNEVHVPPMSLVVVGH